MKKMIVPNWPMLLLLLIVLLCSSLPIILWIITSTASFSSSNKRLESNNITVTSSFAKSPMNMETTISIPFENPHIAAKEAIMNGQADENLLNQKESKNGYHQNGGPYPNRLRNAYVKGAFDQQQEGRNGYIPPMEIGHHANGMTNGHRHESLNGFVLHHIPKGIRPHRRLRIAQIAPLYESVPPKMYGGTERVVHHLTEELVRRGHQVTLFCSADSQTSAEMVFHESWPAFRLNPVLDVAIPYQWMMEQVRRRAKDFDILHFHTMEHYTILNNINNRSVTTLHGLLSFPDQTTLFELFNHVPLVSISDDQRKHLDTKPNFVGTVYHGIPSQMFPFTAKPSGEKPYLAFLGRITDVKRPEWAIEIAVRAGIPLRIAAKVDKVDIQHWEEEVKPLIEKHSDLVEYIGEINDSKKGEFLGNARALLFPIDWNEPFGLVMIEAMACGTPIVARRCGSVPEVIDDGVSGIIFDTIEEGVEAVKRVDQLDRAGVRGAFDRRFTAETMAENYLKIYEKLLDQIDRNED